MSNAQEALILQTLNRLSKVTFIQAGSFDERVNLVQAAAPVRLYSHLLAEVWAEVLGQSLLSVTREQQEVMLREMILLSPNHDRAEALYQALMQPRDRLADPAQPVFMITSCEKYLAKAQSLQQALLTRGAKAWIITGDESLRLPEWHENGCVVPVADTYEALPMKVAAGVAAPSTWVSTL